MYQMALKINEKCNFIKEHLTAAKRMLRYLKGKVTFGLRHEKGKNFKLQGYSDSEFVGDVSGRTSLFLWKFGNHICDCVEKRNVEIM